MDLRDTENTDICDNIEHTMECIPATLAKAVKNDLCLNSITLYLFSIVMQYLTSG